MGKVKQVIFDMAEKIIEHFQLDEESFDKVQDIILYNASNYHIDDFEEVRTYFRFIVVCPQCMSLDGPQCDCWRKERI